MLRWLRLIAKQIRELKLVCKAWRDKVTMSSAVQRSRVVRCYGWLYEYDGEESETMDLHRHMEVVSGELDSGLAPNYDATYWLRVNPLFDRVHANYFRDLAEGTDNIRIMLGLSSFGSEKYDDAVNQYVTEPPSDCIALRTISWDSDGNEWVIPSDYHNICWVYRSAGCTHSGCPESTPRVCRISDCSPQEGRS